MVAIESQATIIEHPYRSGWIARSDNVDEMADMLQTVKAEIEKLKLCEYALRNGIASLATAATKTKRVSGERFTCKVVMPDDYWEQATLKMLWSGNQELAKKYLRISSLAPQMVEVKKLENTSGSSELEDFKHRLFGARRQSNSPPSVSIEVEKY